MDNRLAISVTHADGRTTRWGGDEPDAEDIPDDLTFSTSVPGGYKDLQCSLLRRIDMTYADEALFDTVRVYAPGNITIWEGRVAQLPRSHGDSQGVTPGAVGWAAHLRDDPSFRKTYVDRDMSQWTEATLLRRRANATALAPQGKVPVTIGGGGIVWLPPNEALPAGERTEVMYDIGPSQQIGRLEYRGTRTGAFTGFQTPTFYTGPSESNPAASTEALTLDEAITGVTGVTSTDTFTKASHGLANGTRVQLTTVTGGSNLTVATDYYVINTATNTFQLSATVGGSAVDLGSDVSDASVIPVTIRVATSFTDNRYGMLRVLLNSAVTPAAGYEQSFDLLVVYCTGAGAPLQSVTGDASGVLASDVIADIIDRAAPMLSTSGIETTDFVIPHLAFRDPVTAEQAISLVNGYHAWDWGVWEDRIFFYTEPDPDRLCWEARLSDGARLDLEGDTAEQVFNGVIVSYTDGTGKQLTVGPPGADTDDTDAALEDTSDTNPVNAHSIPRRWEILQLSEPTNLLGATTLGTVWLAQHSLPQRRGSLTLTSTVTHPTKGAQPVYTVRAGDYIKVADHSNSVARKIIETSYTHGTQTITLTLDNTAPKLEALLERLGVGRIGRY